MTHPKINWPAVLGIPRTRIIPTKSISRATRGVVGERPPTPQVSSVVKGAVLAVSAEKKKRNPKPGGTSR